MISYVQGKTGVGTGVLEVDVLFDNPNAAHNMIHVAVGIHTTSEAFTLSVLDTIGNVYVTKNFQSNIGPGTNPHATMLHFYVKNCRPGTNAVKAKSTLAGNIVVCCEEYSPPSGYRFKDYEALTGQDSTGVGTLGADSFPGDTTDIVCLMCGYAEPQTHAMVSTTMRGSFPGGSATLKHTASHPTDGVLGVYDQIYTTGVGIISGCNMVFDSSIAPAANRLDVIIYKTNPFTSDDDQLTFVTFSPNGGESSTPISLVLSHPVPGVAIHYTTDGTTPNSSSPVYSGPIVISTPTTVKAYAVDPTGFFTDSIVISNLYDIFTGICNNPAFIIDGDDTTFAELICTGAGGDLVGVSAKTMGGTSGAPGSIFVDYQITENDLVAPSQTLPAWKVSAFIGATEHVLATGAVGAGVQARGIVSFAIPPGTLMSTVQGKVFAICQIPGSTGGVKVRIYGIYVVLT